MRCMSTCLVIYVFGGASEFTHRRDGQPLLQKS
jgi:hypothetical protein